MRITGFCASGELGTGAEADTVADEVARAPVAPAAPSLVSEPRELNNHSIQLPEPRWWRWLWCDEELNERGAGTRGDQDACGASDGRRR